MALQWPEDPPRGRSRRSSASRPVFGDPLGPTRELFEAPDAGEPRRRWRYLLPIVVLLALLVIVGVGLAVIGPLPTIFPRLDCGACDIRR
jgi:hypothetical protein